VFKQAYTPFTPEDAEEEAIVEATVFDLVRAFQRIVTALGQDTIMDIDTEKLSLTDRIYDILEKLIEKKSITFEDLILERKDRRWIIYTFLAVLELMKTRLVRAYQSGPFGQIRIRPAVKS
jgi:segregation and condensation protein A